jgi:hypothetical protein
MTENCLHNYKFHRSPQSPYNTDISPCDFFLFGDLKPKLKAKEFEILEELQGKVEESLD